MGCLKAKLLLSIWLVLIGASIVGVDQASACSCAGGSAASLIERADVAFEGEVVDVDLESPCPFLSCDRRVKLRVLTPLKGQPGDMLTVYTPAQGTACGYFFKKGERLKVVAWYTRDHRLRTGACAMMPSIADPIQHQVTPSDFVPSGGR
jgi:hypothetical protein